MTVKITREVLESHLRCRYKGYLRLSGECGTPSEYEAMLVEESDRSELSVIDRIAAGDEEQSIRRGVPLTAATLQQGASFVLAATYEEGPISLVFDGLKKMAGPSGLGDFHYIPMLFFGGRQVRKEQKLQLELQALFLSRVQGVRPGSGIVWCGEEGKPTRVRLGPNADRAEGLLQELTRVQRSETPPRLVLNDHCQVCEFRKRCHEQAVREDNISLLRNIGEREIRSLGRKGILTVTQLAHMFRPRRKGKRQERKQGRHYHALKALAIRDKKVYVLGTPHLPGSQVHVYLDIEGIPDEGYVYLIGLAVVAGGNEERFSFWADCKDQEGHIFEQFLDVVGRHDDFLVFCFGSYEKAFLKRMRMRTERKELADKVLQSLVNVLSLVYAHVYFPCFSNGLKEVGGYLGCSWTDQDASGIQSLVWRARWEGTRIEDWKQKLVVYNLEDCTALRRVTQLIQAVVARVAPVNGTAGDPALPPLAFVKDLDRLAQDRKWGRVNFVHSDYEFVNDCAYFDYQRERVFVRTSPTLRKRKSKRARSRNRVVRVSCRVTVVSEECPLCKSKELTLVPKGEQVECRKPRVKRAFDLVIRSSGIRRKVIECRTRVHRCLACGREFVPEQHLRLDKHFHGLKSWAMYQHVAHQLSMGTIQTMCEEFFEIRLHAPEICMFKSLLADYYEPTYRGMLTKILSGGLLHVDETEVQLKVGKGYVWVFTNLEEVVFMYRPTREGDFLKDLLKDFRGVLVSDFYAAYDSVECPQQKCLIHLMRDINQSLLNNPFDQELQEITRPFGTLLRSIVTTIDQHGLKQRHLKRHERDVENYFQDLAGRPLLSEAAEAFRKRLNKYREKLFTFLRHDGVPWNNNNAENAIKRFAYYREDTVGTMKESGLDKYLILLSLCHTCRYKEMSFLKFLLSRERDMDSFCEGRRRQRQQEAIELYPAGFIPPHFQSRKRPNRSEEQPDADP